MLDWTHHLPWMGIHKKRHGHFCCQKIQLFIQYSHNHLGGIWQNTRHIVWPPCLQSLTVFLSLVNTQLWEVESDREVSVEFAGYLQYNYASLSQMIVLGVPCNFQTCLGIKSVSYLDVMVVFTRDEVCHLGQLFNHCKDSFLPISLWGFKGQHLKIVLHNLKRWVK